MTQSVRKYKRQKKSGSYHYISVVFSATLALFVLGIFGLMVLQTTQLIAGIRQNIELQVYLNRNISQNQRTRIEKELGSGNYILKTDDVPAIQFITKEEAAAKFIADTGEDFSEFLGDNPLRDALVIKVNENFQTNAQLDELKTQIEAISGVFEVSYVENLADSINDNLTRLSLLLIGIAVILVIVVLLLINNAIKLALFSQRFLIRSMQLVGAKSRFIKAPFLKRTLIHGAFAGLTASALLYGLMIFANRRIEGFSTFQQPERIFILYGILVALGATITYFSALYAMNKYLKMSLDELY